jgi:class 3 adenylate cyclase/tetratricopeptide (TPR) repeat protein
VVETTDQGARVDVAGWLRGLGLERYIEAFRDNEIDAEVLPQLIAEDLDALGVTAIGHRRKLLAAIAALRQGPAAPRSDVTDRDDEAATDAPVVEAERRQVTVLFADLSGYTELSRELDAEELHQVMGRFFDAVDRVIESYGGTVDKHIGDCVMAVFGAPTAYGNDAERAVRAALATRDAISQLSARLERPLAVHVGVASGQVVAGGSGSAGHVEYTVTGESVNLASRLTDAAGPGELLVSDMVRRALADRVQCEAAGELTVKGFPEPVRAWRLHGVQAARLSGQQLFVGRRGELDQLRAALAACRAAGHGQALYLRGEAGIGKSRLVDELRREAVATGFACHAGQVLDFGTGTGRDAIRGLVRNLLGIEDAGDQAAARIAAETALAEGLVSAERAVYLNDLLDLPQPNKELRALYDAMENADRNRGKRETVAELVARLGARQPRLLVIEDLHWADRLTLAHLARLTEAAAVCPAVLVMTSRIERDPLDAAWRSATGGAPLITIDLGPLHREEALAMAAAFAHAAVGDLAERCVERAAGNPLFLEQLLWHAAEERAEAGVPGSVQSLVQARLDRLAPADKRALQAASVFGQRFPLAGLRHLIGAPDHDCGPLMAQFLVRPQGNDFLFAHALIRDAVYDSLLRSRRLELHRAAADWYQGRDAALRAEHLERAEHPEAPLAYGEAAKAEAAALRYERALGMAERGLALARDSEQRLRLTMLRAECLRELGRPVDSIQAFREALELATHELARCRAWIGVAAGVRLMGGHREGLEALDEAEPLARRHHADHELARICYYRGCLLFGAGDVEGCLAQHEQARAAAVRASDPEWETWALSGLGDAHYGRGRMRLALEHFRRCRDLCRDYGFGRAEVGSIQMIGVTRRYLNEFREAIDDQRDAASMAARVGNRRTELLALLLLGELLVDHGDLERAYAALEDALRIADALGNRRYRLYGLYELGRAVWHDERRRGEAPSLLREALELSRGTGMTFLGPRVLAAMALAGGRESSRRAALQEGETIVRSGCLAHVALWFYRDALEASLNAGDWDAADDYAAAFEAYMRPEPLPWAEFFIARGRALAAHGRGRGDEATFGELQRLRAEAERLELRAPLPALERALGMA